MKREVTVLLRRDLQLFKNTCWKPFIFYLCLAIALDIISFCLKREQLFLKGIYGITALDFQDSPASFPYQWMWAQIGVLMITIGFVRSDLYMHSSSILVRLQKKEDYWISKQFSGGVICLMIASAITAEKAVFLYAFRAAAEGASRIDGGILLKMLVCGCLCMYCLFCIYHVLSLFLPEVYSFLVSLLYLCCGLANENDFFMMNNFMLCRSSMHQSILYFFTVFILCLILGTYSIQRVDILNGKEG